MEPNIELALENIKAEIKSVLHNIKFDCERALEEVERTDSDTGLRHLIKLIVSRTQYLDKVEDLRDNFCTKLPETTQSTIDT